MAITNGRARVVITGAGAITPLGLTVEEFWKNLVAGRSGIAPMTLCDTSDYPTKIAAEVKDWRPEEFLDRKEARRMARFSQFAVVAAMQAVKCGPASSTTRIAHALACCWATVTADIPISRKRSGRSSREAACAWTRC